jgi:16S rRNA (uracil1498-N3)-methyltransferase
MTLRRFVVPPDAVADDRVVFRGGEARHAAAVLRLRRGDRVIVVDGSGLERTVEFTSVSVREAVGRVVETRRSMPRRTGVILMQGVPKGSKMDDIVRMGTELGVSEFVPVLTQRSVGQSGGRTERWRRIAVAAAKQSGRTEVPVIQDPQPLGAALGQLSPGTRFLVLWEEECAQTIASALRSSPRPAHITLLVGPEGGLDEEEVRLARDEGAVPVTLGPLVLRTETAGAAALAMILYELELRE